MKSIVYVVCSLMVIGCANQNTDKIDVLVFTKTNGYEHKSIPVGVEAIKALGQENNLNVAVTSDSIYFDSANLSNLDVIIFLSTTGDVLGETQQRAFENFIRQGGGFVGVHAASDTEYDWPWYGGLVGRYFVSHPETQEARVTVADGHPITTGLLRTIIRTDEWYNFETPFPENLNVLMTLDETSYEGGTMGNHPISWYHEYDGGRSFYTAMGHTEETYREEFFLTHLKQGILWAAGL